MSVREGLGAGFIYDARQKKAVLTGQTEAGVAVRLELVRRNDDDSHEAVLLLGQETMSFCLREEDVSYGDQKIELKNPGVSIVVESMSVAKFRGYTRGNVPTPDIPSDSLP